MTDIDHIEAALNQLLQERSELDAAISALQKRIGKPTTNNAPAQQGARASTVLQPAGETIVYRGQFFSLSITKAAEKLLRMVGRPLKTPVILESFLRAGYEIKAKLPRPTIFTSLSRSNLFVKVLPDTWDLAERHPEAAAKKEQEMAQKKTAKASKKRRANARAEKATGKHAAEGLKTVA